MRPPDPLVKPQPGPSYRYHHRLRTRGDRRTDVARHRRCRIFAKSVHRPNTKETPFLQYLAGAMWLINATALVVLFFRMRTILDVWLVVMLFVSLPDLSLSFLYAVVRYSVGWYTARSYAMIASFHVLIVLLLETTMLYSRLASAMILRRRERAHRLLSVDEATAAIAHEINQPLGAMSLNCATALECLKTTPP